MLSVVSLMMYPHLQASLLMPTIRMRGLEAGLFYCFAVDLEESFWPWLNRDARRYGRSPINVASWVMLPKKAFEWCLSVLSLQFDWVRAGPSDPARSAWARRRALESSWTADTAGLLLE